MPQRIITANGDDIMYGLKSSDYEFKAFGEMYFTWVSSRYVKGWIKHNIMVMNLPVPFGEIKFFSNSEKKFISENIIGEKNILELPFYLGNGMFLKGCHLIIA